MSWELEGMLEDSTMQEQMIYGLSPSFDDLLNAIKEMTANVNQQDWKMGVEFELPKREDQPKK